MNKESFIFGIYPVLEALQSNKQIDKLFVLQGGDRSKLDLILKLAESQNVTINMVPFEKLEKLTRSNHQGVVAFVSPITFQPLESSIENILSTKQNPLFLILDQITDVRNFGAIIRTAECTGVDAIIIQKKGGAPVSADTVKTSAGAIFNIPICKVDHIKDAIFYLQGSGIKVIGATEKTDQSIYQSNLKGPLAVVMGSEEKGIAKSVLTLLDELTALPLLGQINSLNVSVACGAILYEVVRQRLS
jgi:23S rRNA (guanosine2251-2'-O)-methyltransferase